MRENKLQVFYKDWLAIVGDVDMGALTYRPQNGGVFKRLKHMYKFE